MYVHQDCSARIKMQIGGHRQKLHQVSTFQEVSDQDMSLQVSLQDGDWWPGKRIEKTVYILECLREYVFRIRITEKWGLKIFGITSTNNHLGIYRVEYVFRTCITERWRLKFIDKYCINGLHFGKIERRVHDQNKDHLLTADFAI